MEELNLVVSVGEVVRTFAYTIENSHTVGITFVLDLVSDIKDTMFDKNGTESLVWISPEEIGNYKNEGDHDYITLKKYFSLQEQAGVDNELVFRKDYTSGVQSFPL